MKLGDLATFNPEADLAVDIENGDSDELVLDSVGAKRNPKPRVKPRTKVNREGCHKKRESINRPVRTAPYGRKIVKENKGDFTNYAVVKDGKILKNFAGGSNPQSEAVSYAELKNADEVIKSDYYFKYHKFQYASVDTVWTNDKLKSESRKANVKPVVRKSRPVKEDIFDREEGFSTTFWQDFSIADRFGVDAIQDTYNRAFREWKNDYRYLTDLVITLNHKIWQWYEKDEKIARLYNDLWAKTDEYACDNLKGDELSYYYRVTD